jgi:phage tail-like protein
MASEMKMIPAFHFSVAFVNRGMEATKDDEVAFSEVSGLNFEMQTEDILEGGGHDRIIRLPNPPKPKNLVLKRALSATPPFVWDWVKQPFETFEFKTMNVVVSLLGYDCKPIKVWHFNDAFPVKLSLSDLSSTKNEVVIETLELAYAQCKEVKP